MSKRPRAEAWSGVLWLAEGWALFVGTPGDNASHAHHAVQLCAAPEGALRVALGRGRVRSVAAVAIPSEAPHRLDGVRGRAVLLYLDPESEAGRAVRKTHTLSDLDTTPRSALRRELGCVAEGRGGFEAALTLRTALLACFSRADVAAEPAPAPDPRVALAVRTIAAQAGAGAVRSADLAHACGLSPSRLAHLFRREIGLAIRPYVRWTRLLHAVRAAAAGASLTEAAHAAGFADAAHLSRSFRRSFGVAPSAAAQSLVIRTPPA